MKTREEKRRELAKGLNRKAREIAGDGWNRKVFLSDLLVRPQGMVEALADMNRRGWITLVRCDLVEAFDLEKVKASEVHYLNAEWHCLKV